jgi:hypothetical protein
MKEPPVTWVCTTQRFLSRKMQLKTKYGLIMISLDSVIRLTHANQLRVVFFCMFILKFILYERQKVQSRSFCRAMPANLQPSKRFIQR